MAAYVIFQETIIDDEAFEAYKKLSPSTIEKFGGKFLSRGGETDVIEGAWDYERMVILEFPDMEAARNWYNCAEYQEARDMRLKASFGAAIIVART